jgi:hypothetical protein
MLVAQMVSPKLKYYGLFFSLPKTEKSFASRLSLLNFVKDWISKIELDPDRKLMMKYKTVSLDNKSTFIEFDAQEVFTFFVSSQEESILDSVNLVSNEVFSKFNYITSKKQPLFKTNSSRCSQKYCVSF